MKRYVWSICLAVAVVFMASCSGSKYENALPGDAAVVASVDFQKLADKAGLAKNETVKAKINEALKSGMQGAGKLIDKIVEDPKESGIDFASKTYLFLEPGCNMAGILFRLADEGKMDDFFKALNEQQVCDAVKEADGCKSTVLGGMLAAYNGDALLLLSYPMTGADPRELGTTASRLLRQDKDASFVSNDLFGKLQDADGEMAVVGNMDVLPAQYSALATLNLPAGVQLKDIKMLGEISFEKGKVVMDVESLTENKKMKELMKQNEKIFSKMDDSILELFPSICGQFFMAMNVNGEELYKAMMANPTLSQQLGSSMLPVDLKAIISSIDGTVAVGMNPYNAAYLAYADVNNTDFMATFEDMKSMLRMTNGQMVLESTGKNAYCFRMQGLSVWFGIDDNRFYISSDPNMLQEPAADKSLKSVSWADDVDKKIFFFNCDLNQLIRQLATEMRGNQEKMEYFATVSGVEGYRIFASDLEHATVEFAMVDKDKNVLEQFLEMVK
ncbi:DUF4836 family protein [uncultured Bacteroides sp.]|uniref:DUF4836 family protein n=1 Tax=uncultured Bacteroides sp. TaxID=162156 RepID=UPI00261D7BBB|nr:DUF4836 family protein [uncultured Bacteroides sp.]